MLLSGLARRLFGRVDFFAALNQIQHMHISQHRRAHNVGRQASAMEATALMFDDNVDLAQRIFTFAFGLRL